MDNFYPLYVKVLQFVTLFSPKTAKISQFYTWFKESKKTHLKRFSVHFYIVNL